MLRRRLLIDVSKNIIDTMILRNLRLQSWNYWLVKICKNNSFLNMGLALQCECHIECSYFFISFFSVLHFRSRLKETRSNKRENENIAIFALF